MRKSRTFLLRPYFPSTLVFLVTALSLAGLAGCSGVQTREDHAAASAAAQIVPPDAASTSATTLQPPKDNGIAALEDSATQFVSADVEKAPRTKPAAHKKAMPAPPIQNLGKIKDAPIAQLDLTAEPDDLWERIRTGFSMPNLDSPVVKDREAWYVSQTASIEIMVERSKLYLYYIVDELDKRGMPTELALLPMVESAFNPMAYSKAHASGLWQFIPSTGKHYKLAQNWWYDARRDIVASTNAALDYLEFLYEMYGDWQLVLASYNWGENAVAKAIQKNIAHGLPADYANLTMPQETRYYVPKLQALENIIATPAAFGIDLDHIPNEPYFATVPIRNIEIRLAAKLAHMPVEDLIALNPAHKRPVISTAQSNTLVLPVDRVAIFEANLAKRSNPLVSWKPYLLKRGDKLARLATKHDISLAELKRVNGIVRSTRVRPGTEILLPVKDAEADAALVPAVYRRTPSAPKQRNTIYMVKRGDTLYGIADRYNVSVVDLRQWNHLGRLKAGQRLVIHLPAAAPGN